MGHSESEIEHWTEMREKYRKGQWKGHLPEKERLKVFDKRLGAHKASLILGRNFQEDTESFLKRKDLKKFWDWQP